MKKILLISIILLSIGCGIPSQDIDTQRIIENIEIGNKLDSIPQNWILIKEDSKYKKYFRHYPYYGLDYNGYYITTDESDTVLSIYKKIGQ